MTTDANKAPRAPKTLDDEIAKAAARLKRLQDQKRKNDRQALERNERAIADLLKANKLNEVQVAKWKAAVPAICRALGVATPSAPTTPEPSTTDPGTPA
ncbi:hypothetical protein GIY62_35460 (plasmid) [Burkholderia plantarii]|uniref:hypothetical protein n=1 Tax=Burkholderia plantarii TaxID=41899 RepID=UPI00272B5288|nr:hypothetical protein [Burkholderia plantarii]WLE64159.1 hypothetical protein GIY62_35460 [Burkholderia plantarii]